MSSRARGPDEKPDDFCPQVAAEWVDIGSLAPWDKNPRRNDEAAKEVAKSIRRFGFASPIIARTSDRVVIAGHTRLKAAALLGLDKVPVRFLDLDPAEARALALADNKLGELAEWDADILGDVLRELEAEQVDLVGLGFSDKELQTLLSGASAADRACDDDGSSQLSDGLIFRVIVEVANEDAQANLCAQLEGEGYKCQPLIS